MGLFIALSDLHGELETLNRLKMVQATYPEASTVFMGNLFDSPNHDNGFKLLQQIRYLQQKNPSKVIVLRGNREQSSLNFFNNPWATGWLRMGGEKTLRDEALKLNRHQDAFHDREILLTHKLDLIKWMDSLPLFYRPDGLNKIIFVNAENTLSNREINRSSCEYGFGSFDFGSLFADRKFGIFASNKCGMTLVSGNMPTGEIYGKYENCDRPKKERSDTNPIFAIQYPDEYPRYFIDGGIDEVGTKRLGNIGVFDGESGLLIDKYED